MLTHLWEEQPGDFEVVLVTAAGQTPTLAEMPMTVRQVSASTAQRGGLLDTGAQAAGGEILLFLWPGNRLPLEALLTIKKNFALLPQTIGGNFHVHFTEHGLMANIATRFIKQQRYQGRYLGNSGLFVRRQVYQALGGFKPLSLLEDYEFSQRLEAHGPTLYLPDKIKTSLTGGSAFKWAIVGILLRLGLPAPRIAALLG